MIGIYKITSPSNKVYIGQSINIEKRFKSYKRYDCKQQPKIYRSLNKYGVENHKFEILEECLLEELIYKEIYWKKYYNTINSGLNCELFDKGFGPRSEETKNKISQANKGKSKPDKFGDKISQANKGTSRNKGKIHSKETRNKMSLNIKGKKSSFKINILKQNIDIIRKDYEILSLNNLAKKHNVSHFTMLEFLKQEQIFQFRKNYCISKKGIKRKERVNKITNNKPILQYNLEGNFIKEWPSTSSAKTYHNGDIIACLKNKQKTAGGFKWVYKN